MGNFIPVSGGSPSEQRKPATHVGKGRPGVTKQARMPTLPGNNLKCSYREIPPQKQEKQVGLFKMDFTSITVCPPPAQWSLDSAYPPLCAGSIRLMTLYPGKDDEPLQGHLYSVPLKRSMAHVI